MASGADWDEVVSAEMVPAEAPGAGWSACWRCMAEVMPEVKLCAGSGAEGTGWAAGFAESEIAGIAVVCWGDWGDCGAEKVGAGAEEAVG